MSSFYHSCHKIRLSWQGVSSNLDGISRPRASKEEGSLSWSLSLTEGLCLFILSLWITFRYRRIISNYLFSFLIIKLSIKSYVINAIGLRTYVISHLNTRYIYAYEKYFLSPQFWRKFGGITSRLRVSPKLQTYKWQVFITFIPYSYIHN